METTIMDDISEFERNSKRQLAISKKRETDNDVHIRNSLIAINSIIAITISISLLIFEIYRCR
jgi:hypothetical protein